MQKKSLRDINVTSKRVLTRVDFNVPMDEEKGIITNENRIIEALPTIKYLLSNNAKIILCSHMGRPKGEPNPKYSLAPVAKRLSELIDKPVKMAPDCIGDATKKIVMGMKDGDVVMLENLRFHEEEEKNVPEFAKELADLGEIYCDDAFGTAHRKHASIVGVTKYLPSVCGFLLDKEIKTLGSILDEPKQPFGVMLGGAKVEDKVALIENIVSKVDRIIIGGGMAATFLKAKGYEVGASLLDTNIEQASYLLDLAKMNKVEVVLPNDVVVTEVGTNEAAIRNVKVDAIPQDMRIVDMGTETIELFKSKLEPLATLFWNGPSGIYEVPAFSTGTREMVKFVSEMKGQTIIGGGSTAEVVTNWGYAPKMSFVSTGGGASLKFLSGEILPGLDALDDME
jgi:phosphoglycerate kinase